MSAKKTVLVVTGTRADYGLLRPVMYEIKKSKLLRLATVATGMHTLHSRGYTVDEIKRDGFAVDATVAVAENDSMLDSLAKEIHGIGAFCEKKRPDLILVLGDRDEAFAGAIVGGHLGIPVAHLHGGDKTGFVVDEYIRHAITKFSHLHFPASKKSAERIKRLGEEPWRIMLSGGTGLDELRSIKPASEKVLAKRYGLSLERPWYVVLHHPASLDTTPYTKQARGVFTVASKIPGEKIVLSPNADTGGKEFLKEIARHEKKEGFHIFRHIPRVDLINILRRTRVLIGNSSMGIIDASFLRLPSLNVGSRQAGREQGGNVIDCGYDEANIFRALKKAESPAFRRGVARGKSPYGDGRAAPRIVKAIEKNINRADLFQKRLTYV